MAYKIISSTQVELDIEKALRYYKDIDFQLAKDFLHELRKTQKYLQKHPKKLQIKYANVRIAFLGRFPFGIHYRLDGETISILAVFHTSQDTDNWIL